MNQFPSIEEKITKSKHFFSRTNKKPLVGFFLGNEYPNIRYFRYSNLPSDRFLKPEDFSIDIFLKDCDYLYLNHAACGGDLFWTGTPFWGIPWIEAMLGFPISYSAESKSIIATNPNQTVSIDNIPSFSLGNPWVKLMKNFFDKLNEHSSGRYPIGTTRIRGLADILAVLFGGENMVITALEQPELIHKALKKIVPFYLEVMKFQINHIPKFFGGMGSFYYYVWTPHNTVWHQEDSVMLLSPNLYESLIKPYDKIIYSKIPNNICHFHSTGGYIPYRNIISFSPLAVEMHIDSGGPSAESLFKYHQEILNTTPLIIWGSLSELDLDWIFSKLPPQGLAINIVVNSIKEASAIWEKFCIP